MPSDAYNQAMASLASIASDLSALSTQENALGAGPSTDISQCWMPGDAAYIIGNANNYAAAAQSLINLALSESAQCSDEITAVLNGLPAGMDPSELSAIQGYAQTLYASVQGHQSWANSEQSYLNGYTAQVSNDAALVTAGYDTLNEIEAAEYQLSQLSWAIPFWDFNSFVAWVSAEGTLEAADALINTIDAVVFFAEAAVGMAVGSVFGGIIDAANQLSGGVSTALADIQEIESWVEDI